MRSTLFALITSSVLAASLAQAREQMVFSCSIPASTQFYQQLNGYLTQAFDQLGYDFKMVSANPKRALTEAHKQVVDGDCGRAWETLSDEQQLHLLKLPLIATTQLSVWSANAQLKITSATDIATQQLSYGYPREQMMSERFAQTHQLVNPVISPDIKVAIKMLAAKRYDLLIASNDLVKQTLPSLSLRTQIYQVGVFEKVLVYPLIIDQHRKLVPALTAELSKLIPPEGIPLP